MSSRDLYVGTTLLLQLIDKLTAASVLIRQARDEGRDVSLEEVAALRTDLDGSLAELDKLIAEKSNAN